MDGIIFDYQHTHQWVILVISTWAPRPSSSMRTIARPGTTAHAAHGRRTNPASTCTRPAVAAHRAPRSDRVATRREVQQTIRATRPTNDRASHLICIGDETSRAGNRRATYSAEIAQHACRAAIVRL
ncbi:hypothetical protein [Burkholderia multivorans]|uniref:hypothetical protein n=1 Tax=Burkholderia multivorans TaxID=87883 RepID=UPI0028709E02|nr:hypothetical protein [Burkholderia multivorans]